MALTNKERATLADILSRLQKAENYIKKDSTLICSDSLPHALSFYNKEGKGITPMNKAIGSDLNYLYTATDNLHWFLENTKKSI